MVKKEPKSSLNGGGEEKEAKGVLVPSEKKERGGAIIEKGDEKATGVAPVTGPAIDETG